MEELKEMEDGMVLTEGFIDYFDKKFTRPKVNGKSISNEFIEKFIEQLQTYKTALGELEQ